MLFCSASGVARSAPALAGSAGPEGLLDLIPVDVTAGILSAMACRGAEQGPGVDVYHLDPVAAGMRSCSLFKLLKALERNKATGAAAATDGTDPSQPGWDWNLTLGQWRQRVRERAQGSNAERALVVLPEPASEAAAQRPLVLQKSVSPAGIARGNLGALLGAQGDPLAVGFQWQACYESTELRRRWALGMALESAKADFFTRLGR